MTPVDTTAAVLAAVIGRPTTALADPALRLVEDLDVDSLTLLEVVETLQKRLGIPVPDEVTGTLYTVGDLHTAVRTLTTQARIQQSETYLTGHASLYYERKSRYAAAADRMRWHGLTDQHIVCDLGAGYTELDVCLRVDHGWRGRYVPVDAWWDGTDLTSWTPPRNVHWITALELLEHLEDPEALVARLRKHVQCGIVITTPNPETVDVLTMDPTHISSIPRRLLHSWGMTTTLHNFYGTYQDGICAVWTR